VIGLGAVAAASVIVHNVLEFSAPVLGRPPS